MMTEEQKKEADKFNWWHCIKLDETYTTKGLSTHGTTKQNFDQVFGFPESFEGKTILDVGAWDGLFSFEAEKRGAGEVTAIDIYQPCQGQLEGYKEKANEPFQFAKKILNSKVKFQFSSLEDYTTKTKYDVIFYFGVMYHIENPLGAVKKLMSLTKQNEGTIIVETAITDSWLSIPILEYRPGYYNDPTNQFYPNPLWVEKAFKENGAKSVQVVYKDQYRATFRITT
jgi:tRNA (mo5U34)-methyltransferase